MTTSRIEYQDLELPKPPPATAARHRLRWLWFPAALVLAAGGYQLWRGDLWQRVVLARDWLGERASALASEAEGAPALDASRLLLHSVQPIDLRVTTVESGTIESASSLTVSSEVQGSVSILRTAPEGARVEKGDVVVELDSSNLRRSLTDQQIAVEKAINLQSQAKQESASAASLTESARAKAELAVEFARLDVRKYKEGDYPVLLRQQQIAIAVAEEQLERAKKELRFSEDLAKDRYITEGELEEYRFKVKQTEYEVENAKDNARLLEEFTYPRAIRDLESKVAEAERELQRINDLAAVADQQAATNLKALERTLELERAKLKNFEDQLGKCTLRAPQAGIVVYPVPSDEDQLDRYIRPGNTVREGQAVFSIPDTEVLQVSTSLHEAIINQVKPGMQARVKVTVYPDLDLAGEVLSVATTPQPEDWRRTTVKFYETKVKLLDQAADLRPGMSTEVEILMDQKLGVLALPVQSVVQKGKTGLCYVLAGPAPELRRVHLGKSNSQYVEVLEGLSAGERVVLSPDVIGIPTAELQQAEKFEWAADPAVLAGAPEAAAAPTEPVIETEYEAVLVGPGTAVAEAQWEIQVKGAVTKYEFQVKLQGGPPQATWDVTVDGVAIGQVTLDAAGACDAEWNSKKGTLPANFPMQIGDGTAVTVGELQGTLARN